MKVTIDTKQDSNDEIRRTISFLAQLIDKSSDPALVEEEKASQSEGDISPGFINMFGDGNLKSSQSDYIDPNDGEEKPNNDLNIMNIFNSDKIEHESGQTIANESENNLLDSASSDVNDIQDNQMEQAEQPPSFGDIADAEKEASKLVMEY